jgi:hypothetical protein
MNATAGQLVLSPLSHSRAYPKSFLLDPFRDPPQQLQHRSSTRRPVSVTPVATHKRANEVTPALRSAPPPMAEALKDVVLIKDSTNVSSKSNSNSSQRPKMSRITTAVPCVTLSLGLSSYIPDQAHYLPFTETALPLVRRSLQADLELLHDVRFRQTLLPHRRKYPPSHRRTRPRKPAFMQTSSTHSILVG